MDTHHIAMCCVPTNGVAQGRGGAVHAKACEGLWPHTRILQGRFQHLRLRRSIRGGEGAAASVLCIIEAGSNRDTRFGRCILITPLGHIICLQVVSILGRGQFTLTACLLNRSATVIWLAGTQMRETSRKPVSRAEPKLSTLTATHLIDSTACHNRAGRAAKQRAASLRLSGQQHDPAGFRSGVPIRLC